MSHEVEEVIIEDGAWRYILYHGVIRNACNFDLGRTLEKESEVVGDHCLSAE